MRLRPMQAAALPASSQFPADDPPCNVCSPLPPILGVIPPIPTACVQLGVAAVLTVGIGFLQTTLRALHFRSPAVTKGLWLLGGAVVVVRLTGGALAHMASMFTRNASRKRRLQEKLAAVEVRGGGLWYGGVKTRSGWGTRWLLTGPSAPMLPLTPAC